MMTKKNETKPKGTVLTDLDVEITSYDGEFIWRNKESIAGSVILERDEGGKPVENQLLAQEKLTRRKAINLALAQEPKGEVHDADAKLRAGYLQRLFWKDAEVKLDADDVAFIKNRVNFKFNSTVYCHICEFLEGVETK